MAEPAVADRRARAVPGQRGPAVADRWEVGSEFHWDHNALLDGAGPGDWLPARYTLFASGSGALARLLTLLPGTRRLLLPTYFCMGVAAALASTVEIGWYRDLPGGTGPELDRLDPRPGDAVLAVNLFGRGRGEPWAAWSRAYPDATLIEDHTHDPIGDWARGSGADYAFASLRKTLPVPDGAVVWSPRGRELPRPVDGRCAAGEQRFTAMHLKSAWLAGRDVDKAVFRSMYQDGEAALHGAATGPAAVTRAVLPLLDARRLRDARARNAAALLAALSPEAHRFRPLAAGPAGTVPFNVQLVCPTGAVRDALVAHLAAARVYAPVHWRQPADGYRSGDPAAVDLAGRMLTVPVDHRYGPADVRRVAEVLARFTG